MSSLLKEKFNSRIVIVDIPHMILVSSAQMINIFPNAKNFVFPMKLTKILQKFKILTLFIFCQIKLKFLEKNFFDLAINTESFMEMDFEEVKKYINLINDTTNDSSYFFTSNRIRKVQKIF